MKIKIGPNLMVTSVTNDDGTKLDLEISRIEFVADATDGEYPQVILTGYLPAGSEITIDSHIITVQEHPDNAHLHPDS